MFRLLSKPMSREQAMHDAGNLLCKIESLRALVRLPASAPRACGSLEYLRLERSQSHAR